MLHDVHLHKGQVAAGLVGEHVDRHVECRLVGQEHLQVRREVLCSDQFEDHVVGSVLGDLARVDGSGTEGRDPLPELGAMHAGNDRGTGEHANLHAGQTDAAGGAGHEEAIVRTQHTLGDDSVVGRDEHLGEPPGLGPGEGVGDNQGM